jgi:hypothetical protein
LGKRFVYVLKVLLGCQRILDPKGTQTLEGEKKSKKKKGSMKEEGGVHHKKYEGHCMKQ